VAHGAGRKGGGAGLGGIASGDGRLLEALSSRWSPSRWDEGHGLADDDLRLLMEAARWAPSAGNSQPWAFVVGRRGDPTHRTIAGALAGSAGRWAPRAAALVVTLHRRAVDESEDLLYSDYASYDLGQAVAHLTIQARAMALHTHQFAAFDHDAMAERLGVPAHWAVTTGIAVGRALDAEPVESTAGGTAGSGQSSRSRMPLCDFVFAERFGAGAAFACDDTGPGWRVR
jgi:nitroreductase